MQNMKLWDNVLDEQARCAIESNRELLAKLALERKNTNLLQAQDFGKQITEVETEQQKLEDTERRLYTKVEGFRSKKDVIKALFSAAKAQLRIKENLTGISEEMVNVGMATSRTEDKTVKMEAKAQSLEKMSGVLTDYTSTTRGVDIEGTLHKMRVKSSAKLRTSNDRKQQAQPQMNEETTVKHKTDEQEEPVVAE
jgi:phage shock protein A